MIAIADVDRAPTAELALVLVVEPLQPVKIMQVPLDRGVLTVDLEGVQRLVPAGIAGGFEEPEGTVVEMTKEGAGVIDADLLYFAGELVFAFLDERLGHGVDVLDSAVEPQRGIDAMGQQVAGHPGAGGFDVETPEGGAALRQVGADGPVLQEIGAVVEDLSEPTVVDELFGQHHRGTTAVIVPDHVRYPGLLDGFHHFLGLGRIHREGFLAQDHFAGLGGGEGQVGMQVVGDRNVDEVDVVAGDQLAPIGFDAGVAPAGGELLNFILVPRADRLADEFVGRIEEMTDFGVGIGMGAAHEAVADETDTKRFLRHGKVR